MLDIRIIDPYDPDIQYRDIKSLNFATRGISKLELKTMKFNEPYELEMEINANSEAWELFKNNRQYGIRIITDNIDLAFVRYDRRQEVNGKQILTFLSSSYKLVSSQVILSDVNYDGSLNEFITTLDDNFSFFPISPDVNVELATGALNNLEILTELMVRGFRWVEKGLIQDGEGRVKTQIVYGNFGKDIKSYSQTYDDLSFAPIYITQQPRSDNYLDVERAKLSYINQNDSGDYFTHLKVLGDTGQGASANSYITFDYLDVLESFVDPEYPLVAIFNPVKGINEFYIYNLEAPVFPQRFKTNVYSLSSNSQSADGTQEIDIAWAKRYIYNQGVNYLRNTNLKRSVSFNSTVKKIILPGTPVYLEWIEYAEKLDGSKIILYNEQQFMIADNLSFNLEEIKQ